jgi:1-acyl-sn-glycerol-3-phosphate acyltransferase
MSRAFPQVEMEPVYGLFHYLSALVGSVAFRGEAVGADHLPRQGGFLIAANHTSHLDPFIIGAHVPQQVAFFARKTLWKPGFATWWLDSVGTIPVDRDGGSDVTAIKRVLQALKMGRTIIMFPEGTRSPNAGSRRTGSDFRFVRSLRQERCVAAWHAGIGGFREAARARRVRSVRLRQGTLPGSE